MNTAELEYRIIYSMVVAGKSAAFTERVLKQMFDGSMAPFRRIQEWDMLGSLKEELKTCRTGNYGKLERGFRELVDAKFDLRTVTAEQLETIHGIGPKTARFFILWTRPDAKHAALDTHVLKWLRYMGYEAPLSTPSGKKYAALEVVFLELAQKRGVTPRQLDKAIWEWCSIYPDLAKVGEWPRTLQRPAA